MPKKICLCYKREIKCFKTRITFLMNDHFVKIDKFTSIKLYLRPIVYNIYVVHIWDETKMHNGRVLVHTYIDEGGTDKFRYVKPSWLWDRAIQKITNWNQHGILLRAFTELLFCHEKLTEEILFKYSLFSVLAFFRKKR